MKLNKQEKIKLEILKSLIENPDVLSESITQEELQDFLQTNELNGHDINDRFKGSAIIVNTFIDYLYKEIFQ